MNASSQYLTPPKNQAGKVTNYIHRWRVIQVWRAYVVITARVDKYGRPVSATKDKDNLRRFYRMDEDQGVTAAPPDYARGEGLIESSDEEEEDQNAPPEEDEESSEGEAKEVVILGRQPPKKSARQRQKSPSVEPEIDLDETTFDDLDSTAIANSAKYAQEDHDKRTTAKGQETSRIAVVNLDWDHVRASHLYKIFASLVDPAVAGAGSTLGYRGKVLNVRIYPSEFGKERMAREELQGPPSEVFRRKAEVVSDSNEDEEEINAKNIHEENDGGEYDDDALRKYQLERLRYQATRLVALCIDFYD